MYGAILGDIIGSAFEFDRGDKSRDFELFTKYYRFTDDTVLTVAVADALMAAGLAANANQIEIHVSASLRKWGRKYPYAGYGGRFSDWLFNDRATAYGSYGNGSAMRVSAAGWLYDSIMRSANT